VPGAAVHPLAATDAHHGSDCCTYRQLSDSFDHPGSGTIQQPVLATSELNDDTV
jgi:hypothetical protein